MCCDRTAYTWSLPVALHARARVQAKAAALLLEATRAVDKLSAAACNRGFVFVGSFVELFLLLYHGF